MAITPEMVVSFIYGCLFTILIVLIFNQIFD
jgi:hypothetical protein